MDIEILITLLIAFIGWIIGYYVSVAINAKSKRKELITEYLIQAFHDLCNVCHSIDLTDEQKNNIIRAIYNIQLFGTDKQVRLITDFVFSYANIGKFDLNELVNDLRNHLRNELNIENIDGDVAHLRFNDKK